MANARLTIPLLLSLFGSLALGLGGSLTGCGDSKTSGEGGSGGKANSTVSGAGGGGCNDGADDCYNYSESCFKGDEPVVAFKQDVLPILRTSCGLSSSCHGNESGPGGQHYLGPKNSDPEPTADQIKKIFDQSVGQTPVVNAGMNIITPGDPEHSFLMYKLDGFKCSKLACAESGSCGSLMPQGSTSPMDAAKRDIIRRWIAQGAKND
jgi:hypothetical protein